MIKSVDLKLCGGSFVIVRDADFTVKSDDLAHLVYEKDGVWHVQSDPCRKNYSDTVITLPYGAVFSKLSLCVEDGALEMCDTESESVLINAKNASAEIGEITAKELYISAACANISLNANSKYTSVDCGYGTVNLRQVRAKSGYSVNSKCGMGKVTLNSTILPKRSYIPDGERKIDVICGMGEVNISI